jgi:hypothetical protein
MKEKLADLDEVVGACLGLHFAAVTENRWHNRVKTWFQIEAINRSPAEVKMQSIQIGQEAPQSSGNSFA